MPKQFNPKKGYISSSNHKIVGDDYPFYLGETFAQGYRAKRLDNLISEAIKKAPVTLEQAKQIQRDTVTLAGLEFKQRFFSYPNVEAALCGPSVTPSHDKEIICAALEIFKVDLLSLA
jgi:acyl-homoserine lactone acylase PvdQ